MSTAYWTSMFGMTPSQTGMYQNSIFSHAGRKKHRKGVAAMIAMERTLMDDALYEHNCVEGTTNALNDSQTACTPPTTLLTYLHVNDSLHEQQCLAGWCVALSYGVPLSYLSFWCAHGRMSRGEPCLPTWRPSIERFVAM